MAEASRMTCPHCGTPLQKVALPDTMFDHEYDLVCFNDECPYFVRGWKWMEEHYGVTSSYRYRVDGVSGYASPIAVWSAGALRDHVIREAGAGAPGPRKERP